jgi:tetratricopeptide (TPR) repeat protein
MHGALMLATALAFGDVVRPPLARSSREAFQLGAAQVQNPEKALEYFQEAIRMSPFESADDYLIVGNSRMLTGKPALAIVAFRYALRQWPDDSRMRRQLVRAESALQKGSMPIAFPTECLTRRSLSILGAICVAVAAVSFAAGRRTGHRQLGLAGVLVVCLLFLTALIAYQRQDPGAYLAYLIVETVAPLRTGNGDAYPKVVPDPLPAGQEVRVIGRRGTWAHVECPDGTKGWVPGDVLIR